MYSVSSRWTDYTLKGKPIIDALRLSKENYNDALFIHPPFFVYSSAFLSKYLSVPLPLIPLLHQLMVALLMPIFVHFLLREDISGPSTQLTASLRRSYSKISCKAIIVFLSCPIVSFCSQKFWIDNALLLTAASSVALHMWLSIPCETAPGRYNCTRSLLGHCLSGFSFGFLALNTKITALALLPFLLSWTAWQRTLPVLAQLLLEQQSPPVAAATTTTATTTTSPSSSAASSSSSSSKRTVLIDLLMDIIRHLTVFIVSAALAHSPWVYLYWVSPMCRNNSS